MGAWMTNLGSVGETRNQFRKVLSLQNLPLGSLLYSQTSAYILRVKKLLSWWMQSDVKRRDAQRTGGKIIRNFRATRKLFYYFIFISGEGWWGCSAISDFHLELYSCGECCWDFNCRMHNMQITVIYHVISGRRKIAPAAKTCKRQSHMTENAFGMWISDERERTWIFQSGIIIFKFNLCFLALAFSRAEFCTCLCTLVIIHWTRKAG